MVGLPRWRRPGWTICRSIFQHWSSYQVLVSLHLGQSARAVIGILKTVSVLLLVSSINRERYFSWSMRFLATNGGSNLWFPWIDKPPKTAIVTASTFHLSSNLPNTQMALIGEYFFDEINSIYVESKMSDTHLILFNLVVYLFVSWWESYLLGKLFCSNQSEK